jgi:hypothetical protein
MKEKIKYATLAPVWGNRSKSVFGINLEMDRRFFAECSSVGQRNRTKQPICKVFARHYKAQLAMRDKLSKIMIAMGYTPAECLTEWARIVAECTQTATNVFVQSHSGGIVEFSSKAEKSLAVAANHALAEMSKLIALRESGIGYAASPTQELEFPENRKMVYVFHHPNHPKETPTRKAYKIGTTKDFEARTKTHRTSNTALVHVVTHLSGHTLNETNVHLLFKACRFDLEWFLLSDSDVELIKSQHRLRSAIDQCLRP